MEKNKSVKRMDWRQKVLISILGSFIVILSILFYITYHYFVAKIETGNEKVVLMTFEQAEKNLKNVLKNAELCLDKYVTNDLIWDFENNYPETDIESNELKVKITDSFINEMSVNREVSALGFLRGDGWGIVSSVLRKNRTGNTQISGNLLKVLKQSKDAYPYTTWIPSWELNLNNESPLRLMSQNASLIGIKALGESSELEKDGYLIVAVSESDLQSTYRSVAFDDSTAVLVDGNNQIISNVGEKLLGEQLKTGSDTQNIEYDLDIYNWKLCDMIPKQEYMKDAKDIRNFGVLICLAAILSTAFVSIVWSRKYTRPIELLMKNMHHASNSLLGSNEAVYWFQSFLLQWKTLGWNSIIYMAAISGIDQEQYEAARVDGAGYLQCALHVTLPAMMETFVVLFILNVGNFLNTGYEQYLLFKNSLTAPNIEVLDLYTYRIGLQNMDYSYGVAISVVKSLVSISLVVVANLVAKKIRGKAVI